VVIFLTKNSNNKKTAEKLMIAETINSICFLFIVKYSREKMAQRTTLYNGEMTLPSAIFCLGVIYMLK